MATPKALKHSKVMGIARMLIADLKGIGVQAVVEDDHLENCLIRGGSVMYEVSHNEEGVVIRVALQGSKGFWDTVVRCEVTPVRQDEAVEAISRMFREEVIE